MKPQLLDLFCGAGGAAKGYADAGFDVVGVDIKPQPNYPYAFVEGDALEFLQGLIEHRDPLFSLAHFDAIHASPPCQASSSLRALSPHKVYPELIPPTRDRLRAIGLPYVIENVVGSALVNPIKLCGQHFDLAIAEGELRRHRLFESNFPLEAPPRCHHRRGRKTLGIYGGGTRQDTRAAANPGGGNTRKANKAQAQALMGIDWMTRDEMCQAIPPAYTEFVGRQLAAHLRSTELAAAA